MVVFSIRLSRDFDRILTLYYHIVKKKTLYWQITTLYWPYTDLILLSNCQKMLTLYWPYTIILSKIIDLILAICRLYADIIRPYTDLILTLYWPYISKIVKEKPQFPQPCIGDKANWSQFLEIFFFEVFVAKIHIWDQTIYFANTTLFWGSCWYYQKYPTRVVNIKKEKNEKYHETWIRVILTTSAVYMKKVRDIAKWSKFLEVLFF